MLPLPFQAATARGACTLSASSVCLLVSNPKDAASASLQPTKQLVILQHKVTKHLRMSSKHCCKRLELDGAVQNILHIPQHDDAAPMLELPDLLQSVWVFW